MKVYPYEKRLEKIEEILSIEDVDERKKMCLKMHRIKVDSFIDLG